MTYKAGKKNGESLTYNAQNGLLISPSALA
jgi:hypothetical protein